MRGWGFHQKAQKEEAKERRSKRRKVCEKNGQLCFRPPPRVAHTRHLDQNNGQLCFRPPTRVAHASRLNQNQNMYIFAAYKTFSQSDTTMCHIILPHMLTLHTLFVQNINIYVNIIICKKEQQREKENVKRDINQHLPLYHPQGLLFFKGYCGS